MRGIYNSVTDIRRKVFAAIAKMAYDDNTDYANELKRSLMRSCRVRKQNIVIVFSWNELSLEKDYV